MTSASPAALITEANDKFQLFKTAYGATPCNLTTCNSLLQKLKHLFVQFPSFAPDAQTANLPTRDKEIMIARQTLEYAVLLNSKEQNMEEFEQNMAHLTCLYDNYPDVLPSERRWLIVGLNLLRLLAQNRTMDFHMQLELIPLAEHENMYIRDVIQLERFLMEGSYRKLLQARSKVPSNDYVIFLNMMLDTVRTEIADCSRKAYEKLSVEGAAKLLMFDNKDDTLKWAKEQPGWTNVGDFFLFERPKETEARAIPYHDIIDALQGFANDAERIV
jgi:26S proteasome regulatory subunit N12